MRIMPSGNGAFDWLPKDGLTKVASTGEAVEEQDELLEAAKKVVAESDSVEFETDNLEVSDGEECPEVCEDDRDVVDCLETAKDAIEGAIDCLEVELEVEVEDELEVEVEDEDELEVEVEDEVVEGGYGCTANDDDDTVEYAEDVELSVEASTDGWVKVSSISPKNRKKVYDYWSKYLGYPKDFVKLMVKDYEK